MTWDVSATGKIFPDFDPGLFRIDSRSDISLKSLGFS
jgi:hypothetical protein